MSLFKQACSSQIRPLCIGVEYVSTLVEMMTVNDCNAASVRSGAWGRVGIVILDFFNDCDLRGGA